MWTCLGDCPSIASAQKVEKSKPSPAPLLPAEQAWLVPLDALPSAGGALDRDRVYIPLKTGELIALDRETGLLVWRTMVETGRPPLAHENTVYVATPSGVSALDALTGEGEWATPLDEGISAPMSAAGSALITLAGTGKVVALRAADGERLWQHDLGGRSPYGAVAGEQGLIYLSLADSRVVALSLATGMRIWERRLSGILSEPAVGRDRVFVGSTDNFFYALDARSGALEWKWRSGGDVIGSAVDAKGVVYFASLDNVLRAVNRGNGNQRWKEQIPRRPAMPPRTFGGLVLLAGVAPELTAFDATSGATLGSYVAPAELEGPPLVDPDLKPYRVAFVVVTRDGRVAGLRPAALMFREPAATPLLQLPGRRVNRETPN